MTNEDESDSQPDHVVMPLNSNAGKLDYTYIVGGILLWCLIGWGLNFLLHTSWIVFAAAPIGAVCGFFLARHHQRHGSRDDGRKQ
ncbi:hypothetical protein AOC05_10160 [Arthrobacter alpinus]|uniref:DUF2530 domain-containing protein n=1 Tax=Arthrobacter alpinus TaxID=656366 RepID=A0A0M4QX06_9MICC|nr:MULTISPECIES: hypothetical protein [Arthrobacter]ALE92586.1 hypothetical protein AOC05_10160 [Arthrobacter alpinus]